MKKDGRMEKMKNEVQDIFRKYARNKLETISLDTKVEELLIDSLQFVSMIVDLETYFNVAIEDANLDFSMYQTVSEIMQLFDSSQD